MIVGYQTISAHDSVKLSDSWVICLSVIHIIQRIGIPNDNSPATDTIVTQQLPKKSSRRKEPQRPRKDTIKIKMTILLLNFDGKFILVPYNSTWYLNQILPFSSYRYLRKANEEVPQPQPMEMSYNNSTESSRSSTPQHYRSASYIICSTSDTRPGFHEESL